jgi:hypothetical protein
MLCPRVCPLIGNENKTRLLDPQNFTLGYAQLGRINKNRPPVDVYDRHLDFSKSFLASPGMM